MDEQAIAGNGAASGDTSVATDVEGRFVHTCQRLALDEKYMQQALQLFRRTKGLMPDVSSIGSATVTLEDIEKNWTAAIAYVAKNMDKRELPGYTLSQILEATGVRVVDFFNELPQFLFRCSAVLKEVYGDGWEKQLQVKEDQGNFLHLIQLFKYYKRCYGEYFVLSGCETTKPSTELKFGWLLFLAVRGHILSEFPDMVTCITAILSVMVILVIHMPVSCREFSLEDEKLFPKRDERGVDVVSSLSQHGDAPEEDVRRILEKTQALLRTIYPNVPVKEADAGIERFAGFRTEEILYFEKLMDDDTLPENLEILESKYEVSYRQRGNLDERMCLDEDDTFEVLTTSSQLAKYSSQPTASQAMSLPSSPSSPPPPPTPISLAMATARWLRSLVVDRSDEPDSSLLHFLKACDGDLTEVVTRRAKLLLEMILPTRRWKVYGATGTTESTDSMWVEQRRLESLKLYYKVLSSMCQKESERLKTSNLAGFLGNETFHRCMIACSAELVLASHKTVIMTFPAVLEPTGVTAFDLGKVIESFVRYEVTLPRELKRHLNNIEERILESMAWEKGSSMYNALIVAKPALHDEITKLNLLADPMPSLDILATARPQRELPASPEVETPISMVTTEPGNASKEASFLSPAKERPSAFSVFNSARRTMPNAQSCFTSPHKPNPHAGGETWAETVIDVFFKKVMKLAASRIKYVCERVQLPVSVQDQIYRVVENTLYNCTSMFFCRHIDQICLCATYGVCRVKKMSSVSFRGIIYQYRKQPHTKSHIFKNVLMRLGKHETCDVIKFYNEIYVPAVKTFLMDLKTPDVHKEPVPSSPKAASTFPALPDMSPKKVSSKHNVFVSPLRNTKQVENIMSPHSRSLYACLGESTHSYQSPSKDLTAINERLNSRRFEGRLNFDEASLVSDSFVARDFCPAINNKRLPADEIQVPDSPPRKRPKTDR